MIFNQHGNNRPRQDTAIIGGRSYPIVTINGVTWMAENLDFVFPSLIMGRTGNINGDTDLLGWYYADDESTYGYDGYKCGVLYNWYAVKYMHDNKSTLFPGWHVPSLSELNALANYVTFANCGKLRKPVPGNSTSLWDGTNELKFNAVPSGRRNDTAFAYGLLSTSEQTEYLRTYTWNTNTSDASFLRLDMAALQTYHGSQYHGMPVRLIKD